MFKSVFAKLGLGLFAILAIVVTLAATLGVVTDAFACLVKGYSHRCYTSTGSVLWTRSEASGPVLLADEDVTVADTGNGTFATVAETRANQPIACKFDALDGNGPKDALCSYPEGIACTGFVIEPCNTKTGTRTSFMPCMTPKTLPTFDPGPAGGPVTGCTGTVTVTFLDGSPPIQINVAKDETLDTERECNDAYPKNLQLPRGIGGKVVQVCSASAPWSFEDRVLEHVVRNQLSPVVANTASYAASGKWSEQANATCQPDDGFPPVSCTNFGIVRSTFPVDNAAACSAANYLCGQKAGGDFGPSPEACTFDSASKQCTCTCPKCDPATGATLTNVGVPPAPGTAGTGSYVVSRKSGQTAAICPVKVGGQQ